jgi:hypothetical protein
MVAFAVYAVLVGAAISPLFDPFFSGRDDSWTVAVTIGCAQFGLAIFLRSWWSFAVPVGLCAAIFVVGGARASDVYGLIVWLPALLVINAIGLVVARAVEQRSGTVAVALFVLAAGPVAGATVETISRSDASHLPVAVQKQLPSGGNLNGLCGPVEETARDNRRDLQYRARVLLREVRRHPDSIVTVTDVDADDASEHRRDLTVRELTEEELNSLDEGAGYPNCQPDLRRSLRAALR